MSDAYKEYCEEQRIANRMKTAMEGLKKWNTISNEDKLEKLTKLRSEFLVYDGRLSRDISQLNIGYAKEDLTNLRCFILNTLEEIGIV